MSKDIISILPDAIANQIAAGEVIQRPGSAVKELLENAVDAGATEVKLILKDAGRTLIQIIDNGKGMSETDARMCWERHATSKIRNSDDLFRIKSFGFRGEALASIASVAQVEMKTRRAEDELGILIQIDGSELKKQETCQTHVGTSIAVKNLFYNVPARRNFLKSNAVETRHIYDEFHRVALARPEIAFSVYHNDQEVFNLKRADNHQRISDLLNISSEKLIYDEEHTSIAGISVFLGLPEISKKTRGDQYFFVNNRFIKDPYLGHAVNSAYEGFLAPDTFPSYVIFIEIDPAKIDINVHPTKTEIKFEDERPLYQLIKAISRKALASKIYIPETGQDDLGFAGILQNSYNANSFPTEPKVKTNPSYNPFANQGSNQVSRNRNVGKWEMLFDIPDKKLDPLPNLFGNEDKPAQSGHKIIEAQKLNWSIDALMQWDKFYIVVSTPKNLIIIAQQRAHERVLFEKYQKNLNEKPEASQQLLFPRMLEFNPADTAILEEILPDFKLLGFDISPFGRNTFIVNGLPAQSVKGEVKEIIEGILEQYKRNLLNEGQSSKDLLCKSMARQNSIKGGVDLSKEEMNQLVQDLIQCEEPFFTPDRKPVFLQFGAADLNKEFE